MDFLEIRRKAKERAAAAAEARDASTPPAPSSPPADAGATPAAETVRAPAARTSATNVASGPRDEASVLRDADVVAGKVASELRGIAEREELSEGEPDPRFTTWRPGSGERPLFPEPEAAPVPRAVPAEGADAAAAVTATPATPPTTAPERPVPAPRPQPAPPPTYAVAPDRSPEPRAEPARAPAHAAHAPARWSPVPARNPLEEFFYREDEELPGLVSLPGEVDAAEDADHEDTAIEEYLTFELGSEEYAVAIERVREVLKAQPITEVPRAPAGILGVVTVRGEVVAVFDPRRRLGLPGPTPPDGFGRIVIVDDGEGPCGLLVDAVASVVRLAGSSIEPCPQGIGGASADCLAGIGRDRNRLFTVLDLGALLRRAPAAPRAGRAHARA